MNISISHKALSRNIFAQGAINAAISLIDKKPGFYDLDAIKN
jgi:dihydrodipicolinate reductase